MIFSELFGWQELIVWLAFMGVTAFWIEIKGYDDDN